MPRSANHSLASGVAQSVADVQPYGQPDNVVGEGAPENAELERREKRSLRRLQRKRGHPTMSSRPLPRSPSYTADTPSTRPPALSLPGPALLHENRLASPTRTFCSRLRTALFSS